MEQEVEEKLRQKLEKKRKKPGEAAEKADRFVGGFVELIHVSDNRRSYAGKRDRIRKSLEVFNSFGFDLLEVAVDEGADRGEAEEIMYELLYDSALKYVATMDSEKYGKKLLGFILVKPEEKMRRSAADVWAAVNGADFLWKNTGIEKFEHAYALIEKALKSAYEEHDEGAAQRLRHEFLSH